MKRKLFKITKSVGVILPPAMLEWLGVSQSSILNDKAEIHVDIEPKIDGDKKYLSISKVES